MVVRALIWRIDRVSPKQMNICWRILEIIEGERPESP